MHLPLLWALQLRALLFRRLLAKIISRPRLSPIPDSLRFVLAALPVALPCIPPASEMLQGRGSVPDPVPVP